VLLPCKVPPSTLGLTRAVRAGRWKAYHGASLVALHLREAVPRALIVSAVLFRYTSVSLLDRGVGFDYPERALAESVEKQVPRVVVTLAAAGYFASGLEQVSQCRIGNRAQASLSEHHTV
jgi:hypothetical protein